ncbi:hypothetical protein AMAG_01168 [Allomyces macrogynus ATCC 38327]|uniref:Protein YIP n=1 Tax=Allomyces macrogynus (strain ATCC 38327) TaxID=578462 RepID=A0A0L0RYM7_ALLM3|nr:hypothetical protein AMAG_01168 [Allomyces macrogynus ATCC 38327]|eukprot:KNE55255.1 hypothetical protein AMAG_01168 [Allomyces macrogynus ATCC 38327]
MSNAHQYSTLSTVDVDDPDAPASPTMATPMFTIDDDADRQAFEAFTSTAKLASTGPSPARSDSPKLISTSPTAQPPVTARSAAAIPLPVTPTKPGTPLPAAAPAPLATATVIPIGIPFGMGSSAPVPELAPMAPPENTKFYQVEHYMGYFNVDTTDILIRIRLALYPNDSFLTALSLKKDLYGPFWIPTTLIFALFVTSSMANSIASFISGKPYSYDFTRLSVAVSTIYLYTFALPLAVWGVARYYSRSLNVIDLWSIYGYGQTLWLPVTLLCIIPMEFVRWIMVALAFVVTGMFLIRNLHVLLTGITTNAPIPLPAPATKMVLFGALAAHATFALLLKFLFFNYELHAPATSP